MYTLYIDTHSKDIIIILYKDGKILSCNKKESEMNHSVYTMPMIDSILKENNIETKDLNEIAVVCGPGSFTGVRIGVTIAKTMAYLLNIPIKVVDILELKSIFVHDNKKIVVEEEKNGKYVGIFDKNNKEYMYLKNSEYEEFCKSNEIDYVEDIDYLKVYEYIKNKNSVNPHSVNPLYIKKIEVEK